MLKACHCCGLIHEMPPVGPDQNALCTRCGTRFAKEVNRDQSASRTAAAAVGAFVLFWPAILLPILRIDQLGLSHQSSLLSGTIELFRHGNWLKHKALTLRMMEHLGKWSMMDVLLLAFLVMLVKLGDMVEFHFGPAIVAFVFCVAMSMLASLSFDPHAIWDEE